MKKDGKTDVNWGSGSSSNSGGRGSGATWGAFQFAAIPKDANIRRKAMTS